MTLQLREHPNPGTPTESHIVISRAWRQVEGDALDIGPAKKSWCAREDLNLQSFRNQILSLARLPFRHARALSQNMPVPLLKFKWNKCPSTRVDKHPLINAARAENIHVVEHAKSDLVAPPRTD